MALEFLDRLFSIELGGTEVGLGSIIFIVAAVTGGIIVAKVATVIFNKRFAPKLPLHTSKNMGKLIYYGIIGITLLGVITSQGIDLSGLIVAAGIFGVVIGFATQSVVSNLISGIFLMVEKPAKQGDTVEFVDMGIFGQVLDVNTFSTTVQKFDGTTIRVPNDKVFTTNIRRVNATEVRRIDTSFSVDFAADLKTIIPQIKQAIKDKLPFVLHKPEPDVWVEGFGESGVNLRVLVWHPRDDWIQVYPKLAWVIKEALEQNEVRISYPQRAIRNIPSSGHDSDHNTMTLK